MIHALLCLLLGHVLVPYGEDVTGLPLYICRKCWTVHHD